MKRRNLLFVRTCGGTLTLLLGTHGISRLAPAAPSALDARKPVPLSAMMASHQKENMREHLKAVQAIVEGVALENYAAVEKAALTMGYSEEMRKMCTMMGAGAPGFTDRALTFHKTADTIAEAARFKDRAGVMRALGTTLQQCTSCHAEYRQEIVN